MNDYLDNLKTIDLRPKKIKVEEHKEKILLEQDKGMGDIHAEIIKWFIENPNPKDDAVHAFAEKLGINPHKFEEHIYMILSDLLKKKNLHEQEVSPSDTAKDITDKIEKEKTFPVGGGNVPGTEEVSELFIQQGEIEGMPAGARRDMAILRIGIIAELDAASFYERLAELASSDGIKKVLLDVANEEKTHAGEFETLLEEVDPDYEKQEEEGEEEVEDLLRI
jgi:hypothetical protein